VGGLNLDPTNFQNAADLKLNPKPDRLWIRQTWKRVGTIDVT
jgi:hypothetical protein